MHALENELRNKTGQVDERLASMQAEMAEVVDERDAYKQQVESFQSTIEELRQGKTAVEAKVNTICSVSTPAHGSLLSLESFSSSGIGSSRLKTSTRQ